MSYCLFQFFSVHAERTAMGGSKASCKNVSGHTSRLLGSLSPGLWVWHG